MWYSNAVHEDPVNSFNQLQRPSKIVARTPSGRIEGCEIHSGIQEGCLVQNATSR